MKTKSLFLMLIFSFSLLPANTVKAEGSVQRFADSAVSLMYVSDAILYGDTDQEDISGSPALFSPVYDDPETDLDNAKLSAQIHTLKMKRNDRDKNCELMIGQYKAAGKDCEADLLKSTCAAEKASINAQIGKLHDLRGDRRRLGTKTWHFLKRKAQTGWQKLGPGGRRFFRKMGPELMQMVATGGFSGSAAKTLFKTHLKRAFGKSQIKKIALKRIQRMISGQIEIAQAAGLDICDPEEDQTQDESEQPKDEDITGNDFELPDSGVWDLSCQDKDEFRDKYYQTVVWNVTIDWKARTFEGMIEAQGDQVYTTKGAYEAPDIVEITHEDWKEIGSGSVTEDGFFWGDFTQVITTTVTHQGVLNSDNSRESTENWIGAISETLDQVCFYRVGAQDWFTLDWIRERGRNELVGPQNNFCEASCQVH